MLEWFIKILSWIWGNISNIDATISIIVVIVGVIIPMAIRLRDDHNCLKKFGLDKQTKQSMKYYVSTRGFNIDPCDQENIDEDFGFELIPFFMKAFKDSDSQYFIILADSGMGKTTFLLKLYFRYRRKIFKKYHIVLFPLSDSKTFEKIKNIKNKQKTILLLDSFDEDSYAMEDYKKRMESLCNETELFYKIVMTCRTQFFPDSDKEPKITGKIKFGVGKKNIEFEKYYILPFNDSEILTYLKTKYIHSSEKEKYERALKLVFNCPKLMVRPMLLSYIDDLIDNNEKKYYTIYEIYGQLVKKWIEREALDKNNLLHVFSEKVAEYMYKNKTIYIETTEIENLCKEYNINLRSIEAKSRSLLNRNAKGAYKFAHKSILEFFLASNAFSNEEFRKSIILNGLNGYDMLELFIKEKSFEYVQNLLQNNSMKSEVLKYLILYKTDLSGISIIDCNFEGCIFVKTNFAISYFNNVSFVESYLGESIFRGAKLQNIKFSHVDLRKCEFRNAHFESANLKEVNLEGAKLEGANMKGINLQETNLRGASLSWASLKAAKLKEVDLNKAILIDVDLREASLKGVDLSKSYMHYSNSEYLFAYNYNAADSQSDFKRSLEGVDLTGANLSGLNLTNIDFQSAKLAFANLSKSVLFNSDLSQADLRGANLDASIWDVLDILNAISQLKMAKFTCLMIKSDDDLITKVERKELFKNKD